MIEEAAELGEGDAAEGEACALGGVAAVAGIGGGGGAVVIAGRERADGAAVEPRVGQGPMDERERIGLGLCAGSDDLSGVTERLEALGVAFEGVECIPGGARACRFRGEAAVPMPMVRIAARASAAAAMAAWSDVMGWTPGWPRRGAGRVRAGWWRACRAASRHLR